MRLVVCYNGEEEFREYHLSKQACQCVGQGKTLGGESGTAFFLSYSFPRLSKQFQHQTPPVLQQRFSHPYDNISFRTLSK